MKTTALCPVILAGGSGTRLWPLSREGYPKQLLNLRGDHTLLQDTAMRLDGLAGRKVNGRAGEALLEVASPLVVCNEEYRFLILEQLAAAGRGLSRIVLEPASRNTAPALTLAALATREGGDDPMLLVMPADHVILDRERFHQAVLGGITLARVGHIVTFGIVPNRPETGYGYIEKGATLNSGCEQSGFVIQAFVEKPDRATADRYLGSGQYLWNSGMFMMRASVWLTAVEQHAGEILQACEQAVASGHSDGDFYRVGRAAFEACPSDSIDYAVMEKITANGSGQAEAANGTLAAAVIPLDAEWSDIGAWPALLELGDPDEKGNVLLGDVYADDSRDSLLVSRHRFLAAAGVRDLIVVETSDAVLVAHKDHAQEVKQVVDWLRAKGRCEGRTHRRVYRPWGHFEGLDSGDRFQVKRLTVKPGASLSLQMHHHRAEHWVVVRGTARVTRGDETFLLSENESTYISIGVKHRLENPGKMPLEIIEVQSGSYLGEDDIQRFEDRYHRESDG